MGLKIITLSFFVLFIRINLNSQSIEILKDLTGDKKNGINYYGNESASTANTLYFLGFPSFSTKLFSSTGEKGNATDMKLNDSIGGQRLLTASGNNLFFTAVGKATGFYAYNELSNTVNYLLNTVGGDDFAIFPAKNNSAFFVRSKVYSNTPDQIWFSNGTAAGTKLVYESKNFPTTINYSRLGDALIISDASTTSTQKQAIISDGTQAGSMLVKDYIKSIINLDPLSDAIGSGNSLFVYGKNSTGKNNNYIISPNKSYKDLGLIGDLTTVRLLGSKYIINAGKLLSAYDTALFVIEQLSTQATLDYSITDGSRYFFTKDGSGKKDLWETDGTKAGTKSVSTNIGPTQLESFNAVIKDSKIIYIRNIGALVELWEYNYITKSNRRISDLYPSLQMFFTPTLFLFKDKVFFGRETTTNGMELWYYNLVTGVKNIVNSKTSIAYYDQINNQLVIRIDYQDKELDIEILNSDGRLATEIQNFIGASLELNQYVASGIYFVRIKDGEDLQLIQVMKTQ